LGAFFDSHTAACDEQPIAHAIGEKNCRLESCAISALFRVSGTPEQRKVLQFGENVLAFSPYGYSKEKCILPSRS
jgi:hypothetical protein